MSFFFCIDTQKQPKTQALNQFLVQF